jgi:hypothetical protein
MTSLAAQEQERAYFERLQAGGAAPGLAVRRCGDKGKGLFATRCVLTPSAAALLRARCAL